MREFGTARGESVLLAPIAGPGIRAEVITYGAILRSLAVETPGGPVPVTLGYDEIDAYVGGKGYVGAIVGRFANRIGGSRFALDGNSFTLAANEGPNQLHGGPDGFARRNWRLIQATSDRVRLGLTSPDGDMGFPGRLDVQVTYEVTAPLTLRITVEATTDRSTPANFASHAYFNLDGAGDVRDHRVSLAASRVVAVDEALIPTGALPDVADTPFDFRTSKTLRDGGIHYDVNYCLDRVGPGLVHGASLRGARSGIDMDVWTTEPGIQLYDGKFLSGRLDAHAGLCLECQRFPDSPNQPTFPDAILRPGDTLRQITELRFRTT
jgi:aldose 1-epimerase